MIAAAVEHIGASEWVGLAVLVVFAFLAIIVATWIVRLVSTLAGALYYLHKFRKATQRNER